ncbi:hypothetical protein CWS43_11105 [Rahnella sp. AA]|uniref:hypothetical protein n=1 Tax=Rahnella sp. AA TaxID=2057180 RepID=UPI000C324400|nr:hypothetical protein [Rahnella sp. AA]PKE30174.1 hypothetical protein CWS43_11105 [Rahnella sp. AA]
MKNSAPEQKAAAIEAVLKQFPLWSEESKQRLRNIGDASWAGDSDATLTFTYPATQVDIQLQITAPGNNVFKGQAVNSLSPPLNDPGGAGTLFYDDINELFAEGTEFHVYPNADDGPSSQYLVILFCDPNYLYGLFTYTNIESLQGGAVEGTGIWS